MNDTGTDAPEPLEPLEWCQGCNPENCITAVDDKYETMLTESEDEKTKMA